MKITATVKARAAQAATGDGKGKNAAVAARAARSATVEYDVPATLADQVKRFTDVVVAAAAQDSIVIALQAFMRRLVEKGKSDAEVQAEVAKWMPNVRNVVKQTAFEKVTSNIQALTPEQRAALIRELQKPAAPAPAGQKAA